VAANAAWQYYRDTGNWGEVASMLATGGSLKDSAKPVFSWDGQHLSMTTWADQISRSVDQAVGILRNSFTSPSNMSFVVRQLPNPMADAAALARESDPNGYIATQASQYYGYLNEMLYGAPTVEDKSQSQFTGGVGEAAPTPMATAPVYASSSGR
jgi:hypothetical protein